MRVEVKLDAGAQETVVTVTAPARTVEVEELLRRLEAYRPLTGWRDGAAVPLAEEDVLRFYGENRRVLAQTAGGTYTVARRLYELEEQLPPGQFVRISHSEIVNLKQVTGLDLSLSGTIRMTLTGGTVCYVSRRYVKRMKQALGL